MIHTTHCVLSRPHTVINIIFYQILQCVQPYEKRYEYPYPPNRVQTVSESLCFHMNTFLMNVRVYIDKVPGYRFNCMYEHSCSYTPLPRNCSRIYTKYQSHFSKEHAGNCHLLTCISAHFLRVKC
jgi:hypothetical protein